jgi:carbon monoxide dehydrogenase subunit G
MTMEFSDIVTLNAPPETIWLLLEDAENLVSCVPGLDQYEALDSGKGFRGTVSLPFGGSGLQLPAQVEWIEQRAPHQGKLRAAARLSDQEIVGTGVFELEEMGEGATQLLWSATVEVPQALGENRFLAQLVQNFAVRFVEKFFRCLQLQVASQV